MTSKLDKPLPKNYSSCRELRNVAEKQRRDKLNHYVNEVSKLVPYIADQKSKKKVDKISILRLAASYIRLHTILDKENDFLPGKTLSFLKVDASKSLLKAIGGFLLVITSSGKVLYVSAAVEESFGYSQADILGQCFFQFIHQDDVKLVQRQLISDESSRCSFYCRMLEKGARSGPIRYEIIHVVGTLKKMSQDEAMQSTSKSERWHQLRSRTKASTSGFPRRGPLNDISDKSPAEVGAEEQSLCHEKVEAHDSHMLISLVKIVRDRPITEIFWMEAMRHEYITRHTIDGTITHADHRISFVAGMLPEEVIGKMAYAYIHKEDVLWSLLSNRRMFFKSEGEGVVTIRLACKDGKYKTIRCRGFLELNKTTGQVESFVCINTAISKSNAAIEIVKERKEIAAMIQDQSPQEIINDIVSQLPPTLLVLLKNLLIPEVFQEMLKNPTNVDMDSDNTTNVQHEDLARKYMSLPDHPSTFAAKLQFTINSERLLCGSQSQDGHFVPYAKRQKHCHPQLTPEEGGCVDLLPSNIENIVSSTTSESRTSDSFSSNFRHAENSSAFCDDKSTNFYRPVQNYYAKS